MIKINDKKTAIVGGVIGLVILLTIFCCEGKQEAAPVEEVVEEVVIPVEEVTPAVEEVTPEVIEEVTPAETVE